MALKLAEQKRREDLMATISERLWRYEPTRSRELPLALTLADDGVLTIGGHAPSLTIKEAILDIIGSVDGVKEVKDELIADPALEVAIAQELALNEATQHLPPGAVQVFAQVGNVVLVGDLDGSDRQAVQQVVEGVTGVRQVVDRMQG